MSFTSEIQKHWQNLRTEVEEFALQMSLGKAEAKDRIEVFQKEINQELAEWQERIRQYEKENEPQIEAVKQEIETFRVQMSLGKAETKEQIAEYAKNSREAFDRLSENISKKLEENQQLRAEWENAMNKLEGQMSKVRGSLEGMRLQISLGEMDAKEDLEKIKNDLSEKVSNLQKSAEDNFESKTSDLQKWFDSFRTELAERIRPKS